MSGGFLNDFVGAGGCDGAGNGLTMGVGKMFGEMRLHGNRPDMAQSSHSDPMADELIEFHQSQGPPVWQEDYFAEPMASENMVHDYLMQEQMQQQHMHAQQFQQPPPQQKQPEADWAEELLQQPAAQEEWVDQFKAGEDWVEEYNEEGVLSFGIEGEEPATFEAKQENCGFFKFLEKVKLGEIQLEDPVADPQEPAVGEPGMMQDGAWHDEYVAQDENAWLQQYRDELAQMNTAQLAGSDGVPHLAAGAPAGAQDAYQTAVPSQIDDDLEYIFEENNPYMYHDAPYKEGLELLEAGSLAEAALAFEAVCQKEPQNTIAWQHLGSTQAENEKDKHAIAALQRCRKLDPENRDVLMALSVSYTNESNVEKAIETLSTWLLTHPRFREHAAELSALQPEEAEASFVEEFLMVRPQRHSQVVMMFEAAQRKVQDPPPDDVWTGLGVLYHMSRECDKAVANFEKVLQVRPDDAKIWNKLGASLANSHRCSEAIKAYNRALDLNPGFVRALYNMGVSYSNLGEHQHAAEIFLRAIFMQNGGRAGSQGSGSLWQILRLTFSLMNRSDLVSLSFKEDVEPFRQEFNIDNW
ncbi:Peroxisomal targeting signal receptor [Diplonema papillatum]|nr:Peroxisomal targeting signal receptor [Diplonema papillatum]